jgi:hypothetical protein
MADAAEENSHRERPAEDDDMDTRKAREDLKATRIDSRPGTPVDASAASTAAKPAPISTAGASAPGTSTSAEKATGVEDKQRDTTPETEEGLKQAIASPGRKKRGWEDEAEGGAETGREGRVRVPSGESSKGERSDDEPERKRARDESVCLNLPTQP